MNKSVERRIWIVRESKNELRVDSENSCYGDSSVIQTEQGAMIEVGAILGANLLHLNDGDVLEIKMILHRKEGE